MTEQEARVHDVRGQAQPRSYVADEEQTVGESLARLGDHRLRGIDAGNERVRVSLAQQQRGVAGPATQVEQVAAVAGRDIAKQGPGRLRERVGDETKPFTCKIGVAEGVSRHTGMVARSAAAARRDFRRTTPSAEPRIGSDARSGCGIRPTTLRASLQMPAMSSRLPFGLST